MIIIHQISKEILIMTSFKFFPVSWNVNNKNVHIYGLEENKSRPSCIRVVGCPSRVVIELDDKKNWTSELVLKCLGSIKSFLKGVEPKSCKRTKNQILMGAHVASDGSPKLFDFLDLEYENVEAARSCEFFVSRIGIDLGGTKLKMNVHMTWVELWLQYALKHDLPICDWLQVQDCEEVGQFNKQTICDCEYIARPHDIVASPIKMNPPVIPTMAYDIEVYSAVPTKMPEAFEQEDKIFQVSMIIGEDMILITRGMVNKKALQDRFPNKIVSIIEVSSETKLIEEYVRVLLNFQPLVLIGYNNMQFDGPYMIERAKSFANCFSQMERHTMHLFDKAEEKQITWSSAANPDQKFMYMRGEGFQTIDLLAIIKKDYKLSSYKLDNVAAHFLQTSKDEMCYKELFKIYERSIRDPADEESINGMTRVGEYCLQDSQLVLDLFNSLKLMGSLVALSTTTSCKLEELSTRGAQHKVVSTILRFCKSAGIVVNRLEKTNNIVRESYRGATVFEPVRGLHDMLVSFDFASLYPSLMLMLNLCVSTLVTDESIPDEKCKVLEWEDHVKCEHDTKWIEVCNINRECMELKKAALKDPLLWTKYTDMLNKKNEIGKYNPCKMFCGKRKFRWYQGYQGVYPKILSYLLKKRAEVRGILKTKSKERVEGVTNLKLENEIIALNSEQLALKVVANSLYGFTGASTSPFACVAIAQSTTFMGRTVIEQASQIIRDEFGGFRVYGDTDSNYIKFDITDYNTLYEHAKTVAREVSNRFPECLNIEFEGDVYDKYLIVNKKQYAYSVRNPDGTVKSKIGAKGLLLVRRDNCPWVRTLYEKAIRMIFANATIEDVVQYLFEQSVELASHCVKDQVDVLTITKSVGNWGSGDVAIDRVGKTRMGKYIVPKLSEDVEEQRQIFESKGFDNAKDFYSAALPAHVQLAKRMNERGTIVVPGERLAYVVTGMYSYGEPMQKRLESCAWFSANSSVLQIDYLQYINSISTAADTILEVLDIKTSACESNSESSRKYYCKCCKITKKCLYCKLFLQYRVEKQKGHCAAYTFQMIRKNKLMYELRQAFCPRFVRNV